MSFRVESLLLFRLHMCLLRVTTMGTLPGASSLMVLRASSQGSQTPLCGAFHCAGHAPWGWGGERSGYLSLTVVTPP